MMMNVMILSSVAVLMKRRGVGSGERKEEASIYSHDGEEIVANKSMSGENKLRVQRIVSKVKLTIGPTMLDILDDG